MEERFYYEKIMAIAITMIMATSVVPTTVTAFAAETTQRTIEVSGRGVVTAKPDVANIYMTVETKGKTAEQAQKENTEIAEQVTNALKALDVKDENIVTLHYSVDIDRAYNERKKAWEQQGYRVYNRFMVKVTDVNNVGKYIDAATKAGVTSIGSVSFSIDDPTQYYKQALQAAVKNASSSATALAEALGTQLDDCIFIEEMTSYNSYAKEEAMDAISNMATTGIANMDARSGSSANIKYEDIEIIAGVTMKYAF